MPIPIFGQFVVAVLGLNIIAQEAGGLLASRCDQGLFPREFQLESLLEESSQLAFDLLGFRSCSRKTKQHVIGITDVTQSSGVGIVGISGRKLLGQSQKLLSRLMLSLFACCAHLVTDASVGRVVLCNPGYIAQ